MLVLTRHAGESIRIGNNIEIKAIRISGNIVRIGIDAPAEINIVRSELVPTNDGAEGQEKDEAA